MLKNNNNQIAIHYELFPMKEILFLCLQVYGETKKYLIINYFKYITKLSFLNHQENNANGKIIPH